MNPLQAWAEHAYLLAKQAGEVVMQYYSQGEPLLPEYKSDNTPLTLADKAAHQLIYQGLENFALDAKGPAPILSEEGDIKPFVERQGWHRYWCVDPLDGTKDFLAHSDEFTINIALIEHHRPILGVIYVPVRQCGYLAWQGGGAYCRQNASQQRIVTKPVSSPKRVLVSRYHTPGKLQPYLTGLGEVIVISQGSALKFCTLAQGEADIFLRLGTTSEWDNAAGHCLLEEAGGRLFDVNGNWLTYNRSGTLSQGSFIALGDPSYPIQADLIKLKNLA